MGTLPGHKRGDEWEAEVSTLTAVEDVERLLQVFETIAEEQGWKPEQQLRAYNSHSVYFGLTIDGQLAGGLQLVLRSPGASLPCLSVWPELEERICAHTDVADIALLALNKDFRGKHRFFWPLCIEMWRSCRSVGIRQLWAEVTPANLCLYRRLGWPLCIAGPLRSHWCEPCFPCFMGVDELADSIAAKAATSRFYHSILAHAFRETDCTVNAPTPVLALPLP